MCQVMLMSTVEDVKSTTLGWQHLYPQVTKQRGTDVQDLTITLYLSLLYPRLRSAWLMFRLLLSSWTTTRHQQEVESQQLPGQEPSIFLCCFCGADWLHVCRGLLHFDFVSSIGVPKTAVPLADGQLALLVLQRCHIELPAASNHSNNSSRASSLCRPDTLSLQAVEAAAPGTAAVAAPVADAAPLSAAAAIRQHLAAGVPGQAAATKAKTLLDNERTRKLMDLRILSPELVLTAAQVRSQLTAEHTGTCCRPNWQVVHCIAVSCSAMV